MKTYAILLPALLTLTPAAQAQQQDQALQREIQFIRGLVNDLRFFELAEFEAKNLAKKYREGDKFKQVEPIIFEVTLEAAKRHPDRTERRGLYQQAIELLDKFLERYAGDKVALDAQKTLADACIEFGRFLIEELELAREEAPEKVAELEEQAGKVFRKGVEAAQAVMTALRNEGKHDEIDYYIAWLRKGILLREHGRAVAKDRKYLCDQAREALENLVLEIGEETALGQKALFEMAQIYEVVGNLNEAARSYNDTVEQIVESLNNEELKLPEAVQRLMFDLLQEVYDHLCEAYFQQGKSEDVLGVLAKYRKNLKDFDATPHTKFGDSLFLMEARVMAESGKQTEVTKALATAKEINQKHPNDFVGLKAKKLLDVILTRSSDLVTGDVLLEIAKGYYQEKKYDLAIAGFKEALRGMTAEDRQKLGLETWNLMGRANYAMDRYLEAALCYKNGLELYGAAEQAKDPNVTTTIAKRLNSSVSRAIQASSNDAVISSLDGQVKSLITTFNPAEGQKDDYSEGLKLYSGRKYAEAAAKFALVQPDFERYEMALGYRAICLLIADKWKDLEQLVQDYEAYQKSPQGTLKEEDRIRRQVRQQARAWVHYAHGRMRYEDARGRKGKDDKEDLTRYPAVIKHFLAWEREHADSSPAQMAKANEILGVCYIKTGDVSKALARYQKLKPEGKHKYLGDYLFRHFEQQQTAFEKELEAVRTNKGSEKDVAAIETRLTEARKQTLAQGMDYCLSLGDPNYDVLFTTMKLAEQLESWEECEKVATKILKLYSKEKAEDPSFPRVKPSLGNALLHQSGKLQQALDVLTEAEKDFIAKKKDNTLGYYEVVRLSCMALGGWPRFDAQLNYRPNLGMGKPKEAYDKYYGVYRNYAKRFQHYTIDWYRFHLEAYFFAREAGKVDSTYSGYADKLYSIAKSTDDFQSLLNLGEEGKKIHGLFGQIR